MLSFSITTDGPLEVFSQIRMVCHVPISADSLDQETVRRRGREQGAADFAAKPFALGDLDTRIHLTLAGTGGGDAPRGLGVSPWASAHPSEPHLGVEGSCAGFAISAGTASPCPPGRV